MTMHQRAGGTRGEKKRLREYGDTTVIEHNQTSSSLSSVIPDDAVERLRQEAERLLAKITPGEWSVDFVIDGAYEVVDAEKCVVAARAGFPARHFEFAANAEFIAAAPRLVRALLSAITQGQQERSEADTVIAGLRDVAHGWLKSNAPGGWIDDLRQANASLTAQLATVTEENTALREIQPELWADWQQKWDEEHARAEAAEASLQSAREAHERLKDAAQSVLETNGGPTGGDAYEGDPDPWVLVNIETFKALEAAVGGLTTALGEQP